MNLQSTIAAPFGGRRQVTVVADVTCRPIRPTRRHRWWERGFLRSWPFVPTIRRGPTRAPSPT